MCFFMTILPQPCQYGGYSAHSIRVRNFYLFTQIAQLFNSDLFNLSVPAMLDGHHERSSLSCAKIQFAYESA